VLLYSEFIRPQVTRVKPLSSQHAPKVIPRSEHLISRANVSEGALKVLYRLKSGGFQAYLVGGCVRDLLLGREPKDFDVATDATPEQVKGLFRSCLLIGRRFRLAHVRVGREVIEVATFRAGPEAEETEEHVTPSGRILSDNVYGTQEEDAWRRDFTVNALYYNIADFSVVDYVGGIEDLRNGALRLIGDPDRRYREDPVRMLRAVRFAARLGFRLHPQTEEPIWELGHLLAEVPPARLFEEVLKLFLGGFAVQAYELLRHYRLFGYLFPMTEQALAQEEGGFPHTLVTQGLANTDARVAEGSPVMPAFLFATLLWEPLRERASVHSGNGRGDAEAMQLAIADLFAMQRDRIAIPRRIAIVTSEIWALQSRFAARAGRRPGRLLAHPRFRAAYDFMLLRAASGEEADQVAAWWTRFQAADEADRAAMIRTEPRARRRRRPSRRVAPGAT
jgi:poly(A) polymerase